MVFEGSILLWSCSRAVLIRQTISKVVLMLTEVFEKSLISDHYWTWYDSPLYSLLKASAPLRVFRSNLGEQYDPRVQA